MNLLGKALFFLLIGFTYCQGFYGNQASQNEIIKQQLKSQAADITHGMQEKCRSANQTSIANSLEDEVSHAIECIVGTLDPEKLIQKIGMAQRTGSVETVFNEICKLWPDVHKCINPIILDVKKCLNKEEKDAVDFNFSILDDTNQFFCDNNARKLIDFMNGNGLVCFQISSQRIGTCTKGIGQNRKPKENKLLATFDSQDCSDFRKGRSCIVTEMQSCPNTEPAQIMDDFLAMIQHKVCNSASKTTLFSTLNIFLVLCLFVYSKMF